MPSHIIFALILSLTLWQRDETQRSYGGAGHDWRLVELHGVPFDGTATLTFPTRNVISGRGPCNSYTSHNAVPFPWFEAGPIAATRSACPALGAEAAFFDALQAATYAKISTGKLVLADDTNDLLVFRSDD